MSGVGSNFSPVNNFNKINAENEVKPVSIPSMKLEGLNLNSASDLSRVLSRYSSITQ